MIKNRYILNTSLRSFLYIRCVDFIRVVAFFTGIFFFSTVSDLTAQSLNIGNPVIQNFNQSHYKGGIQTWDIIRGQNDYLFFANNDGLIVYDNANWEIFPLPKKTILRSIALGDDDRIYAGGQDEIGYYYPDEDGCFSFHSIRNRFVDAGIQLEDIWEIAWLDSTLFFRSLNTVFEVRKDTIVFHENGQPITFMAEANDIIFYNNQSKGIYQIADGKTTFLPGTEKVKYSSVMDLLPLSDSSYLVLTEREGVFELRNGRMKEWGASATSFLKKNRIISGAILDSGSIAIGTFFGGVLVFDANSQVRYLLDKTAGLQNNNISAMCTDGFGNLWLGSNNGIDQIEMGVPLQHFSPDGNFEGAVYDIELWNGWLFFGTNNGLYYLKQSDYYDPFRKEKMKLVPNSSGQVWGLDVIDDQLFMAHNEGAFKITHDLQAHRISASPGAWKFLKYDQKHMLVGTYSGIDLYQKVDGEWQFDCRLEGFLESSRIMVIDDAKNIWVTHPYRGVYKLNLLQDWKTVSVEQLQEESGVVDDHDNYIFSIKGDLFLANDSILLKYESAKKSFVRVKLTVPDEVKNKAIKRLIDAPFGIWVIYEEGIGKIVYEDHSSVREWVLRDYKNTGRIFVGGFENLFSYDDENLFLCSSNGVYNIDTSQKEVIDSFKVFIRGVDLLLPRDSVLYGGFGEIREKIRLDRRQNSLRFRFANNYFVGNEEIRYTCKLFGLDSEWSSWSTQDFKEYGHLKWGSYTFAVKGKNLAGTESEVVKLPIIIVAPWYASVWMLLFYGVLFFAFLVALVMIPSKKHKKKTAVLITANEEASRALKKLQKEKLQAEIQFKNKELASTTLHLLQKNETLHGLKTELLKIKTDIQDAQTKKSFTKVIRIIDNDIRTEDDWEKFSFHFDQVYNDFIKRISMMHPKLTPNDLKLCAYLKMNLKTKEIAPLLNISPRGVEISRYRLRKKLNLSKETNLNKYMMDR